jgi:hypothetical protein
MKIKILKDKWCGMRKLVKNRESWFFSQSWYIRNTSSMNELGETAAWRIIYD